MVSESSAKDVIRFVMEDDVQNFDSNTLGRGHETFFFRTSGGRYVLKVSNDKDREDRFQVEGPVNKFLSSNTYVPVPNVVDFDNSKQDFNFMYFISEFEDGENICTYEAMSGPKFKYLSVERKKRVLESAGEVLGMLHNQTSFKDFGFLKSRNQEIAFRTKGGWKDVFKKIIIEKQMNNFPERFCDLKDLIRGFLEENLSLLEDLGSPCLIHQDYRWPNIKVKGSSVSTVFDWERALAGHPEYDLAKAEESLIQLKSDRLYQKYRESFLKGYKKRNCLEPGWDRRVMFYKALRPVEAMWTFEGWTDGMSEEKRNAMARYQRNELNRKIEGFKEEYS
jgi:aminoglycoside phosphotransferase (APT) family kinase protein